MARKKILVSESVKGELLDQYSGVDNISLGDFSAQVIGNGLDDLKNSEPPGASPRVVPRANGNKYVEFSLDDHKQLDREVQKFKKDKKIHQGYNSLPRLFVPWARNRSC
jgi:hypothetical protein